MRMSAMKKVYTATIMGVALIALVQFVTGYTSALAIPKEFFDIVGLEFGLFLVILSTVAAPFFLVSIIVLPILGFVAGSETMHYALISVATIILIDVLLFSGSYLISSPWWQLLPNIIGRISVLVVAWYIGKRYTVT